MGSESVWECINTRMSWYQDIAIPNPLAKFKLGHTRILPFLPVPSIAKTSMSGGVWMAFEGVLMMSRWCLRVSGEASIHNMLAKTMLSYCYIFFQCPVLHKNVLCLGVSVLCLGVSG